MRRNTNLFSYHIHYILNPAVWNEWENARVNDAQVLHSMHFQTRIDDALLDVFAQPIRAAGMESRLAPFQDGPIHGLVGGPRHGPRVVAFHEILHGLTVHQDVVDEPNTLAHSDQIDVVAEEVEVDGRLVQVRGGPKTDLPRWGQGSHQVDNDGQVVSTWRRGYMPLEGVAKHGL
jgi:hypothetical protein